MEARDQKFIISEVAADWHELTIRVIACKHIGVYPLTCTIYGGDFVAAGFYRVFF